MILDAPTIDAAFQKHGEVYASQKRWSIAHHVECWHRAAWAFEPGGAADFQWLYDQLRTGWQVFRSKHPSHWSSEQTSSAMAGLDPAWRGRRLATLGPADAPGVLGVLAAMAGIKQVKAGTSVVAVSKFLHFWNPGLFVIVDDAMMWRWVFARRWIRGPILALRDSLGRDVGGVHGAGPGEACDPLSYAAILLWSADLVRRNPLITARFAGYVRSKAPDAVRGLPLERYEGAAVEWLLLGLVELPPPGVRLD